MPASVNQRVQKSREGMRAAGLRPIQIWVPDLRKPGLAEECHRQASLVAIADGKDEDISGFMDAVLADSNDE